MQKHHKEPDNNGEQITILRRWIFEFKKTRNNLFAASNLKDVEDLITHLESAYEFLITLAYDTFINVLWWDPKDPMNMQNGFKKVNKDVKPYKNLNREILREFTLQQLEKRVKSLAKLKYELEQSAIQASTRPYTQWQDEFNGNIITGLASLCNFFPEIQEKGAPDNFLEGLKRIQTTKKEFKEYISEFLEFVEAISELEDISRLLPYISKWVFAPLEIKTELLILKDIDKIHDYLEALEYGFEVLEDLMEGDLDKTELEGIENELDEDDFERELTDQIEEKLNFEQQNEQLKKLKNIIRDFQLRAIKASLGSHNKALSIHNNNPYFMSVNMYNNSSWIESNGNWKRFLGLLSTISSSTNYDEVLCNYAAKILQQFTEAEKQGKKISILNITPIEIQETIKVSKNLPERISEGTSTLSKKMWGEQSIICGVKIIGVKTIISIVAWQSINGDDLEEEISFSEDKMLQKDATLPEMIDIVDEDTEDPLETFEIPWDYINNEIIRKQNKYGSLTVKNTRMLEYLSNKVVNKVFRFLNRLIKKGYGEVQLVMEDVISFDFGRFQNQRNDHLSLPIRKKLGEMIQAKIEQWGLKHPAISITLVDSSGLYDL
ncbi:MAG: hypothetical protein ACFFC7_15035 [Candidatus Hermodarchaeota archaeon]